MKYQAENDLYYIGEGDPYVYTEQKRDYGAITPRAKGKSVLDFGAHCGFFNLHLARNHPPASITSIEPDSRFLPALKKNCMPGTSIINAAVVDKSFEGSSIGLYLGGTYGSKNTVHPVRGREVVSVPAVAFQDYTGVNFIKCDCEGGEYQLDWRGLPASVETIVVEFHFRKPEWEASMNKIVRVLTKQGFSVPRPPKLNTYSKISVGYFVR